MNKEMSKVSDGTNYKADCREMRAESELWKKRFEEAASRISCEHMCVFYGESTPEGTGLKAEEAWCKKYEFCEGCPKDMIMEMIK